MEAQLLLEVQKSLDLYLYRQAQFLCERMCAQFPSEANTFLLATCYYRNQEVPRAYNILKELRQQGWTPRTCYFFAQCCYEIGRLSEAEKALSEPGVAVTSAACHLLGRICRKMGGRSDDAIKWQAAALHMDPCLWVAFEELCELGAGDNAMQILEAAATAGQETQEAQVSSMPLDTPAATADMFPELTSEAPTRSRAWPADQTPAFPANGPSSAVPMSLGTAGGPPPREGPRQGPAGWASPAASFIPPSPVPISSFVTPSPSIGQQEVPAAPRNDRERGREPERSYAVGGAQAGRNGAVVGRTGSPAGPSGAPGSRLMPRGKFFDDGKLRKVSGRLFNEPASSLRKSSRVLPAEPAVPELLPEDNKRQVANAEAAFSGRLKGEASDSGMRDVLSLIKSLGTGWRLLCMYRCKEAVDAFQQLPVQQRDTGWVYMQIGRAYYEMASYDLALRAFEDARRFDRFRLEGLEYYSSVLWHLKKEVDLAYLAQEVSALDRRSPFTWLVVGNCFSLQKEHEAAIRFFQRALQLDSGAAYAYTLCGHEYFANEDFENAMKCYQNAERLDPRHYNAMYGQGQVYFRQEKWDFAAMSFSRALSVNQKSSVLHCYMGITRAKQGKPKDAMNELNVAIAMDPHNPLAKYERASLLLSVGHTDSALAELHALKELAPREASIWFQMGKIYKKQRKNDEALAHFRTALDLKPSSNDLNLIKSAIEKLNLADEEQDEEI